MLFHLIIVFIIIYLLRTSGKSYVYSHITQKGTLASSNNIFNPLSPIVISTHDNCLWGIALKFMDDMLLK